MLVFLVTSGPNIFKYHDFVDYFTSSAEIDEAEKENLRRWKEKTKDIKPVREHTLQARAFHVTLEAARQKHDLTEYFERYDLDGSGVVRASEFTAASTASGFFFSLSECRWLAEKFKMRGVSDGVDYKSFFLWATESASRVQAVGDKLRTMVANLARKEGNMDFGPILRAFDPSETNRITKKSLKGGLEKLRLELSDSEIDVLMGHFTTDQDGNIQYETYTSFVFDEEGHRAFQRLTKWNDKLNTNKDFCK